MARAVRGRERNGDDFAAPPGLAGTRQAGPSYMTQANIRTGGSPGAASTRAYIGVAILSANRSSVAPGELEACIFSEQVQAGSGQWAKRRSAGSKTR